MVVDHQGSLPTPGDAGRQTGDITEKISGIFLAGGEVTGREGSCVIYNVMGNGLY